MVGALFVVFLLVEITDAALTGCGAACAQSHQG